jgi:hypothetical protein
MSHTLLDVWMVVYITRCPRLRSTPDDGRYQAWLTVAGLRR